MGSWGGGGTAEGALLKEVVQGGFAVLNMENSVGYSVFSSKLRMISSA